MEGPHTDLACRTYIGISDTDAARMVDAARARIPASDHRPAYQIWREQIDTNLTVTCPEAIEAIHHASLAPAS